MSCNEWTKDRNELLNLLFQLAWKLICIGLVWCHCSKVIPFWYWARHSTFMNYSTFVYYYVNTKYIICVLTILSTTPTYIICIVTVCITAWYIASGFFVHTNVILNASLRYNVTFFVHCLSVQCTSRNYFRQLIE